jgi:prephenate dehydrogenase
VQAETIGRVAIIGYGTFGQALATLIERSGKHCKAWDARQDSAAAADGSTTLCASLQDALVDVDLAVFSVPVRALQSALQNALPHLQPDTIVVDVGSVKVGPQQHLDEAFGDRQAWVATHPLFGPVSLSLDEKPRSVVVCPNSAHPEAVRAVEGFYRELDCEIVSQTAEEHDRLMAKTHALVYFIAKALVDLGIDQHVERAPPSFRALARTIESVRVDAGHLVATVQRENPFAPEVRRALIDALSDIDAQLSADEGELSIPAVTRTGE